MLQTVSTTIDADGVMIVALDSGGKVNTITSQMLDELAAALDGIERRVDGNAAGAGDPRVRGVVFTSVKADAFLAGADLHELRGMSDRQREAFLVRGQELFDRIARLRVPTTAAINGDCLGGGLELALACRYRIAAQSSRGSLGLPELRLGLIPAWGGTVRLPRLVGIPRALKMILTSESLSPRKALKAGLVDEVVRPEALRAAALRKTLSGDAPHEPGVLESGLGGIGAVRQRIFETAHQRTLAKTHGHYPAAEKVIEVMRRGYAQGPAAGLLAEREALVSLMQTDVCRNLMRLFFLRSESRRWIRERVSEPAANVTQAAVIGGGTMGSGIVYSLIRAGVRVRLVEANHEAMSSALRRISALLDADVSERRLERLEARHALNRVAPSVQWTGLGLVDLVIEAVAERLEVKQEVFGRLGELTRADAVLATNTSSLRVDALAEVSKNPQRVVGLHFFNPVPQMPLVEVVAGPRSSGSALATAARLAERMGKVAVLVKDAPGFVVNRVMVPYLAEPLVMANEGMDIRAIDRAMAHWGMPMGPFELLDRVGLDIAAGVLDSLHDEDLFAGHVASVLPRDAIRRIIEKGWLGEKSGLGFYRYNVRGRKTVNWPVHEAVLMELTGHSHRPETAGPLASDAAEAAIQERLVLAMINAGARLLREGVIDRPDALDLATVFGLGFAPFRGGLVRCADTMGVAEVTARLDALAGAHGPRFAPDPLLRERAEGRQPLGLEGAAEQTAAMPAAGRSEVMRAAGRRD